MEKMKEIYYIVNSVNETSSSISGYFPTYNEALDAIKDCHDWYRPDGTGKIYRVKFGLEEHPEEVYSNQ